MSRLNGIRETVLTCVLGGLVCCAGLVGCGDSGPLPGRVDKVWGRQGVSEGRFSKPRAITIDNKDNLYIVDMTARIQVFDSQGKYLRSWQTPMSKQGRPTGMSFDREGHLLVADTHYFRVLFYTPEGELLEERTIGGECGSGPGQFNFVTDVARDSHGNFFVGEYGEFDRIQKFSPEGKFLYQWGSHGPDTDQFIRPQALVIDSNDHLWVADSCNHRIKVYDITGDDAKLIKIWGEEGTEPGALRYPMGMILDGNGHVYVAEFGNHRVQKFTLEGKSVGIWGRNGRRDGELNQPWSLVQDSQGRLHVLDTYNHRVQTFRL